MNPGSPTLFFYSPTRTLNTPKAYNHPAIRHRIFEQKNSYHANHGIYYGK